MCACGCTKIGKYKLFVTNVDGLLFVYIGVDVNDLPCMEKTGLSGCTADEYENVKKIARYVIRYKDGQGAAR